MKKKSDDEHDEGHADANDDDDDEHDDDEHDDDEHDDEAECIVMIVMIPADAGDA